jgi:putative peptide zinc metalloprotease protein
MKEKIARGILATLVGLALAWGTPGYGLAQERDDDDDDNGRRGQNYAIAVNTDDGSSLIEFSFQVVTFRGDTLDHTNVAIAYSSCEECRTIAVAFQIVVAMDSPSTVTPTNLALAINFECTSCETFASAYQFVVGGDNLRLTGEGRAALQEIRRRIKDILESSDDMTLDEIQMELDLVAADIRRILAEELVARAPEDVEVEEIDDDEEGDGDDEGPTQSPSPDASPETGVSPTPEETLTESPSESPTPEENPTETSTP